jgi:N-acyl amino acid synthase of PEP-CTERM/exosortase system
MISGLGYPLCVRRTATLSIDNRDGHDSNGIAVYGKYFSVVLADTPMLMEEVYRLRYQVYCNEQGFERPDDHASGLETDGYDHHSVHAALIHRDTGQVCGCVLGWPRLLRQQVKTLGTIR